MRFLSHIRKFGVQVVEPRVRFSNYGDRIVDREGYVAVFAQDLLTDDDVRYAREIFEEQGMLNGRTTQLDEVTMTPIRNRLSVFDTDEEALRNDWTPEFKKEVEDFLLRRSIDHPDFRVVVQKPVEPPWPRYMDFRGSLDDLIRKLREDGYTLEQALEYEKAQGQRKMVIERLEQEIAAAQSEEADSTQVPA